jgi:hypothetical protein
MSRSQQTAAFKREGSDDPRLSATLGDGQIHRNSDRGMLGKRARVGAWQYQCSSGADGRMLLSSEKR